ncbi:MAG: hypothetical protein DWQ07_23255 [Chloroflexi bacterium]|nr:MAG: hypothetical protein DWQ07_23255 [Chloroflexota bacterium]MBL1194068.1 hypothetical protein [Chloroflexota bacterium]NOH11362.1 hypothetical protein [Chloroflexota bacterium]
MTSFIYNVCKKSFLDGAIDLNNDTINVALVSSAYAPDKDGDLAYDDLTNEVAQSGGYLTGGKALSNTGVTQDNVNNRASFDGDDVTWETATINARAAVLYKDTGTPSSSTLIAYIDFGQDYQSTGGDFTIQWSSDGIFYLGE